MISPILVNQIEERHPVLPKTRDMFQNIKHDDYIEGTELEIRIAAIYNEIEHLEDGIHELKKELLDSQLKKSNVSEQLSNLNIKKEMNRATQEDLEQLEFLLNSQNFDENSLLMKIKYKQAAIEEYIAEADKLKEIHFKNLGKIKIQEFENQIAKALATYKKLTKEFEVIAGTAKFFENSNVKTIFPSGFDSHISFDGVELFGILNYQFGKLLDYSGKYKILTLSSSTE